MYGTWQQHSTVSTVEITVTKGAILLLVQAGMAELMASQFEVACISIASPSLLNKQF